jgi:hypothetical protein
VTKVKLLASPPGDQIDVHDLDAFIEVGQHKAGNGRARHDRVSELQAVEPLVERLIAAVGRRS